ncbi:MAG TPA: hypothetical protein VHM19_19030, partial [Polyangiales bacterium]|nr:hypothetical protein [Polyangiales bacterium]
MRYQVYLDLGITTRKNAQQSAHGFGFEFFGLHIRLALREGFGRACPPAVYERAPFALPSIPHEPRHCAPTRCSCLRLACVQVLDDRARDLRELVYLLTAVVQARRLLELNPLEVAQLERVLETLFRPDIRQLGCNFVDGYEPCLGALVPARASRRRLLFHRHDLGGGCAHERL